MEALSWEICFIWHNRICKKKKKIKQNEKVFVFLFFLKMDIQCLYCKGELGGTLKAMKKVNNTLMLINLQTLFVVQSQFRVDFNLISCWVFFCFFFEVLKIYHHVNISFFFFMVLLLLESNYQKHCHVFFNSTNVKIEF